MIRILLVIASVGVFFLAVVAWLMLLRAFYLVPGGWYTLLGLPALAVALFVAGWWVG